MTDPKPLTRQELAEFLPSQRAIRAFEKLFDLIPLELEDVLIIAEESLTLANSAKSESIKLKQRVEFLENKLASQSTINLDPLIKRIEVLETLEG